MCTLFRKEITILVRSKHQAMNLVTAIISMSCGRLKNDVRVIVLLSSIMRPFYWAAKQRLITENPFKGVDFGEGMPRRPITDAEFQAVKQEILEPRMKHG